MFFPPRVYDVTAKRRMTEEKDEDNRRFINNEFRKGFQPFASNVTHEVRNKLIFQPQIPSHLCVVFLIAYVLRLFLAAVLFGKAKNRYFAVL